ncbi:BatD family protein [Candidatus Neomarinimicrobiota bacterium]
MVVKIMRFSGIFLLSLTILSAEPRAQTIVSDTRLIEGQSFTLEVRSEDGEIKSIGLDGLADFRIISGPATSRSVQIINGVVSSSTSYTWTLIPTKSGQLTIPPIKVQIDGRIVSTQSVAMEVIPGARSGLSNGNEMEPIFLRVDVDPREAYRGEQITVTWTLYTQMNISGWEITSLPNLTGFWTEELFAPNRLQLREKVVQGRRYYTAVVRRMAIFPTQSGDLEIDPLILKIGVQTRNRRQYDPFFDDFSLINPGRVEHRVLASPPIQIKAIPTPWENRPPDYAGLVGRYSLSGSLDQEEVNQDDAVVLALKIGGEGNFKTLDAPAIKFPRGLEVFEPKLTNEPALGDIVGGTRTIEYVIIPRAAGRFTIPRIRLPFFSPATDRYEVGTAGPFTLNVLPRDDVLTDSPGFSRREVALLGQDIRFLKMNHSRWLRTGQSWYTPTLFLLNLATILLFLAPVAGTHVRDLTIAFTPGIRARRAYSLALQMIEDGHGEPGEIYLVLTRAITLYLNYKLRRDTKEYTIQQVNEILMEKGIMEEIHTPFIQILEHAASARFAPVPPGSAEVDREALKDLLTKVESQWGK